MNSYYIIFVIHVSFQYRYLLPTEIHICNNSNKVWTYDLLMGTATPCMLLLI